MKTVRRLIIVFSCLICLWVFGSVAGAFLDPAHPEFWSTNLMWSLLSSLLVAPALVMAFTGTETKTQQRRPAPHPQRDSPRAADERDGSDTGAPRSANAPSSVFDESGGAYPVSEEADT